MLFHHPFSSSSFPYKYLFLHFSTCDEEALTLWLSLTSHLTFKLASGESSITVPSASPDEEGPHRLSRSSSQKGQASRPRTTNSLRTPRRINHSSSRRSPPPRPLPAKVPKPPGLLGPLHPRDPPGLHGPDAPGPRAPASSRPSLQAAAGFPEPPAMRPAPCWETSPQ